MLNARVVKGALTDVAKVIRSGIVEAPHRSNGGPKGNGGDLLVLTLRLCTARGGVVAKPRRRISFGNKLSHSFRNFTTPGNR